MTKSYDELLTDLSSYNERTKTATETYESSLGDIVTATTEVVKDRNNANKWASEVEDTLVDDGVNTPDYSANHYSKKAAASADLAANIADPYKGLWPDSGGSAEKGDEYQTQTSGTPTGQYFTALQNTTVDPVSDNVNWREVLTDDGSISRKASTLLSFDTVNVAKANESILAGYSLQVKEEATGKGDGAKWDAVAGQSLPIVDGVVNHDTLNLQLVRRDNTRTDNRLNGSTPSKETKVFAPKEALFAFHFDGPYITNFEALLDKADELGVPVCIGSINDLTNGAVGGQNENSNYGYVGQLVDAQRRGHEIYNHGYSGSLDLSQGTNVSEELQDFWVNYSHEWLQSLGINAQMWVTSNGGGVTDQTPHLDPKYIPKILERHSVAFGRTSSPWNDVNGFRGASFGADTSVNTEGLTRANIEGVSQAMVENFVDYCIENKRVAVFHGHDSGNSGQLTVAEFEAAVNYIHSKGYRVTTSQDVFASFTNLFTDDAVTAKAANIATLENKSVIQENLLTHTNLKNWTRTANPNIGTVTFNSFGDDRVNGEQFQMIVADPVAVNGTYDIIQTINRPFNTNDVASLCLAIQAATTEQEDFGIECVAQFFTGLNGSGTKINEFRRGAVINGDTPFQMVFADGTNFFTYSNVQSVKLIYQVANKTLWSGSKTLNLFNPRFNRGNVPAEFFKKYSGNTEDSVTWKGQQASTGTITLDQSVADARFIKIEVGVNNTSYDVRGSALMGYNIYDRVTVRAWSGASIYTDFVVKFNSATELEVLSESATGGGDFAVLGIYKY